ncbi:MAG TPA: hypothetical protein VFY89_10700 [Ktedonobacterales bacterium]
MPSEPLSGSGAGHVGQTPRTYEEASMIWGQRSFRFGIILTAACTILLSACSSSGGGTTGGGGSTPTARPTPTPVPCDTRPTTTAETWISGQQVMGMIPAGGSATTLSHFVYPLGIPDENAVGNAPFPGFTAIAPDAQHLAVAIIQYAPNFTEYDPFIVDTTSHAVTRVPLPHAITTWSEQIPRRLFAWASPQTLIIFGDTAYSYDVPSNTLSTLPGISGAVEGVVRCSTLYYLTFGTFTPLTTASDPNHNTVAPTLIHRYNLSSHTAIGAPINIGQASTYGGAEGQIDYGGWDVSPDGSHLAYQHETVTFSGGDAHRSSHWFAAHADGTSPAAILPVATANTGARMSISPHGDWVAVTSANPAPNVLAAPMSGGATHFFDAPPGDTQPAWRADNTTFLSGPAELTATSPITTAYSTSGAIHSNGVTAHTNAHDPATLG